MPSSNQKGGAYGDGFGRRSGLADENGCGRGRYDNFGDWNIIPLVMNGQFYLSHTRDNPRAPAGFNNRVWNRCNRTLHRLPEAPDPVKLDDLREDELEWVLDMIREYGEEMDFFSMITQEDVYNKWRTKLLEVGMEDDEDLLAELNDRWRARQELERRATAAAPAAAAPAAAAPAAAAPIPEEDEYADDPFEADDDAENARVRERLLERARLEAALSPPGKALLRVHETVSRVMEEATKNGVDVPMVDANDFICPITREVMTDPVVTRSGHSYERGAIERYMRSTREPKDPLSRKRLVASEIYPNFVLKKVLDSYNKHIAAAGTNKFYGIVTPGSQLGGGKKSRRKRTKRRRTTGGKKSRKLRKHRTLKGGKRKRRRTRRRR